jgi:arylsulfatase A-like enzyme
MRYSEPMMRRLATWLMSAVPCALLAGALVGLVETVRLAGGTAGLAALAAVVIGLTALFGLIAGVPLLAAASLLGRAPWWQRFAADLREPGATRVAALVRGLVTLAVAALFWLATYRLASWTHERFRAAGAIGVLEATVLLAVAAALLIATLAITPLLVRWLGGRRWLHAATRGWPGLAILIAATAGAGASAWLVLRQAAPDADLRPGLTALGFVVALAALAGWQVPRRLGRAGQPAVVAALFAAVALSLATVGGLHAARLSVASHGIASLVPLRALWRVFDRDRDGHPSRFGGADCDDGEPTAHPGATEIPDNGVDENCAGGDLGAELLAPRLRAQPSARPDAPRHNVILISIDAVRADHLSAYGYERPTTPVLAELAGRSTRFAWAITASPTTRRAIPALVTGRYASTLAFREGNGVWPPALEKKHHTLLGETFRRAGYETRAVMCCTTLFDKAAGVVEGIDQVDAGAEKLYRTRPGKYNGDEVAARVTALLRGRAGATGKPLFLWLHFIDPHNPYVDLPGAPSFGTREIDRYDSEIAYIDARIGEILAALREAGMSESTVIAVVADHGDEFYEHGNHFHGKSLYNEVVRVPLILHVPGAPPRVVAEPVSVVDVAATLLDLVGLDRPAGQNGRSLAAAVRGEGPAPDRTVLAELIADRNITRNLVAAFHGTWKLIWDLDANTYELYSLVDDPGDTRDLAGDRPDVTAEMRRRLDEAVDRELTLLPTDKHAGKPRPSSRPAEKPAKGK